MTEYKKIQPINDEHFNIKGGEFHNSSFEIGKSKYQDFITDSLIVDSEIRIKCGASHVNLFRSRFVNCTFWPSKEMKNLRFNNVFLENCIFKGKYSGCRFGAVDDRDKALVTQCDFSQAKLFHLCDFLKGADPYSCTFPAWPHILVTDLKKSKASWLKLKLPAELELLQGVIGDEEAVSDAVSVYLPAETKDYENLRELLSSQSFIKIS